ncbi:hypothetical protein OO013_20015, partial [Mangrovivirga sp. M17]
MKTLILILFIIFPTTLSKTEFDKVVLYEIEMDEESGISRLFDYKGNIRNKNAGIEIELSKANKLIDILNDSLSYGARHPFSHAPSIGLIFYKNNKIVNWIEIALETNSISSKIGIKNQ